MSKLMRKNIALKQGFFVEARFLYEWKNEARRISASFTLVFKIEQLTQKNQSERWAIDNGTINGNDLGTFFSENILMPHILGLHPREVYDQILKEKIHFFQNLNFEANRPRILPKVPGYHLSSGGGGSGNGGFGPPGGGGSSGGGSSDDSETLSDDTSF